MTTRSLLLATWKPSLSALVVIACSALLASCAGLYPVKPAPKPQPEPVVVEKKPPPEPIKPPPPSRLYHWKGSDDFVSRIEISINEQKARFYSGEKEVGWTTVASGLYKRPTPVGSFAVLEKVQNKRSNLYGRIYNKNGKLVKRNADLGVDSVPAGGRFVGASMPFFLRLTNDGIGMHAGPIPHPGRRASHGCIRMPKKFAPILYRYVSVGTPVTIKGKGPSYASYLKKQRKSAPKRAPAVAPQPESAVASVQTPASPVPEQSSGTQPVAASDGATAATGSADTASPITAASAAPGPSSGAADVAATTPVDRAVPTSTPNRVEMRGVTTASQVDSGPAPASPEASAATGVSGTPAKAEAAPPMPEGSSAAPGGPAKSPAGVEAPAAPQEAQVKPVVPSPDAAKPAPAVKSEAGHSVPSEAAATPAEPPAKQPSEG